MLRSMTGFGRCFLEEADWSQTWEVRSVNGKHLDIKWRLPLYTRSLEGMLEKCVRRFASRGRVEISLHMQFLRTAGAQLAFNSSQASAMLEAISRFAISQGSRFEPDYNRLLSLSFLWEDGSIEPDGELATRLENGLATALEDWNEAREIEGKSLGKDLSARILRMGEWVARIEERAPGIKEERFVLMRDRIAEALESYGREIDENRFLQEIVLLSDRLDVSEELTRLNTHLDSLRELLSKGIDAGRRLDFTMQECFREINTCGNKIQDAQISRLVVDFKNELEKCREQVQNME